jgi:hypothetical protein
VAELESARRVGAAIFAKMLAPLDADEIEAFGDYLRRCVAALEADVAPEKLSGHAPKSRAAKRGARPAAPA